MYKIFNVPPLIELNSANYKAIYGVYKIQLLKNKYQLFTNSSTLKVRTCSSQTLQQIYFIHKHIAKPITQ